jgi:hypothetical protein
LVEIVQGLQEVPDVYRAGDHVPVHHK